MNTTLPTDARQRILDAAAQVIGRKGFAAVGLNEVLLLAKVPKGSFYHYFSSKDAFGQALLESYFQNYLAEMDQIFEAPAQTEREKLEKYWQRWLENQSLHHDFGKCLVVKLGAELADLSEPMRLALDQGTAKVIQRIGAALSRGLDDGSFRLTDPPSHVALRLYQLWLGASVMTKITRTTAPFDEAISATRHVLNHS
ncbi:TetR/AcrR family transcriptional regulator [Pseudomonas huanghezhanensis]|uniref:TetR/AcrR family transcriptional regulator n=1 Tax=Pseudomonas huanghezhanensis TaxID=3002903 RepID=UPI0022866C06|nr:TetR/AcrR family transcriptional regulator [Pseudomonas sp. BSw22131]